MSFYPKKCPLVCRLVFDKSACSKKDYSVPFLGNIFSVICCLLLGKFKIFSVKFVEFVIWGTSLYSLEFFEKSRKALSFSWFKLSVENYDWFSYFTGSWLSFVEIMGPFLSFFWINLAKFFNFWSEAPVNIILRRLLLWLFGSFKMDLRLVLVLVFPDLFLFYKIRGSLLFIIGELQVVFALKGNV